MQNFLFIAGIVIPVFLIVAVGYLLKKIGILNDNFVQISSKVVFNVSLPALIFIEISTYELNEVISPGLIIFVYAGTIISFILIWILSNPYIKSGKDKSAFIQGSFRGNFAIVGLAIINNFYGSEKLGKAAIVLAFTIPLYNVLSVLALTIPLRKEKQLNYNAILLEIIKNPLIIAVVAAFIFSYADIKTNEFILITGEYLGSMALPLALLGIGGILKLKDVKTASVMSFYSTIIKLVIVPLTATLAAYFLDFRNDDLGIIFILFACPTAIASFIMAEAMGVNSKLAGNILLITTLVSAVTMTAGLYILSEYGLI